MTAQEVLLTTMAGKLTWWEAAGIIRMRDRSRASTLGAPGTLRHIRGCRLGNWG
jgi:hypothetical protein